MGWYGTFLVPKLKLVFYLKSVDESLLHSSFESLERFFDKRDKLMEDIEYVQETSEDPKNFSAKATAKMFNIIDELGHIPEASDSVFLLYFLNKQEFEINYHPENKVDLGKLKKKGWQIIE